MTITPHNKPIPSKELRIYQSLFPRMNLSTTEKLRYENLSKGHLGEIKFYDLLNKQPFTGRIEIYDLLLESNQTEFQIDSLIINQNTIFPLEIKNFAGDFCVEGNNWYAISSKKEIRNPLLQLQRTEFLFKQVLHTLHVNMEVKPYVIFVNEEFTLYQSPLGQPIIYPTQLKRFIKKLNFNTHKLTANHNKIAEKLISLHIEESKNSRLPEYDYHRVKKGITCKFCTSFLSPYTKVRLKCKRCSNEENIESAVMRAVDDFQLLFPNRRITTGAIHEWCKVISNKKRIMNILKKNMTLIRNGRFSYYVKKQ